jgi:hypothetical protein
MMGKVHGWGTFSKWEVRLSQGLLVWKCPNVFFFQSTTGTKVVNIQTLDLDDNIISRDFENYSQ